MKKTLYSIQQFPCTNEIALRNNKGNCFVSQKGKVARQLNEYDSYLSHDRYLIFKGLDYIQVEEIKQITDKFFYAK